MFNCSKKYYYYNKNVGKFNLYFNCTSPFRDFHILYPLSFDSDNYGLNLELNFTKESTYNTKFGAKTFLNLFVDFIYNNDHKVTIINHFNNSFEFNELQNGRYVNNEVDYVCSYSETPSGTECVLTDKYGNSYIYVGQLGLFSSNR